MAQGDTHRSCSKTGGPGPCCNALEAGLVPRNGGIGTTFTYQSSSGHQRCAACEIVQSKAKKNQGKRVMVFKYHPRTCGASGCTALAALNQPGGAPAGPSPQQTLTLPSF